MERNSTLDIIDWDFDTEDLYTESDAPTHTQPVSTCTDCGHSVASCNGKGRRPLCFVCQKKRVLSNSVMSSTGKSMRAQAIPPRRATRNKASRKYMDSSYDRVVQAVCATYGIDAKKLREKSSDTAHLHARQITIYFLCQYPMLPLKHIGDFLNVDLSSVYNSFSRITDILKGDTPFSEQILRVQEKIRQAEKGE